MIRYRMPAQAACAAFSDGRLSVTFREPIHGVAPGQAVVCYSQDLVIGGGTVTCAS
jgi:tRNA-specific 2-thiouridylase